MAETGENPENEKFDWPEEFHEWTEQTLHTHKVNFDGESVYSVHQSHPVVQLLVYNQDVIGVNMANVPRDSRGYLPMNRTVFDICITTLKKYAKFPTLSDA